MRTKAKININYLPTIFENNNEKELKEIKENKEIDSSKIKFDLNSKQDNISLEHYLNIRKQKNKDKPIRLRKEIFNNSILNISSNKKEKDSNYIKPNSFFIEKIIKKNENIRNKKKNKSFSNHTPHDIFLGKLKHLDIPFVNDKIIFSKGETEKLLNYEFYKSSYNACCDINQHNSMYNKCIKTNYNNNWNLVKQFAYEKRKNNKNTIKDYFYL